MAGDEPKEYGIHFPDYPPMDESGTVDLWQLEENLRLTPQERMKRFAQFAELCDAFRAAGRKHYGQIPPTNSEAP